MNHKLLKSLAIIVLFFFLWTFAGICNFAYAVDNLKDPPPLNQSSQTPKAEERFQKVTEDIGQILEDLSIDTNTKKAKVKTKKEEIESLDGEIRNQFAETEKKLKDANLPEEILQRHYKFVKHYEDNLNELKGNLDAFEKAGTEVWADKIKAHLERVKPPKKHIPLDPNKLPHRTQKLERKEPRLKKEDFEKDFIKPKKAEAQRKPILVASNGSLKGLLSPNDEQRPINYEPNTPNLMVAQATNQPTVDDLGETIEVQFTPEIIAKAQELGNNPVKIFEYVKNNFFFEAYYGSLKGAHETLLEQAGNDFDQASLLLALLRVSNISARYVYGTVEIPIERMKKWLGVENENVVGDILASNGIPVSLIQEGGKISKARLEHVWIEAWVTYDNYRGHPNSQNKIWIPLDPSFKQVRYTRGPDLKQIMNFDPNAFMNELMANSTYSTTDYYVSSVSESFIQQKLEEYQNNLQNYVTTNMPDAKPQDLIGKFNILYEKLGILPATLPYKIIAKGATYSVVPDNLRHKLQIKIKSTDYGDLSGSGDISYQTNLSQLAGKKITISYMPLTTADENTLKSYGTLSTTPAYLVNMKPVLMIDGVAIATGGEIGLGKTQQVDLTFSSPNISTDIVTHNLNAGGYHAIGIDLQRIPKALLQKQTGRMQAMKTYLESILSGNPSAPPPGDSRDNLLGDMLYDVAINYFYNLDAMNDLMSRVTDIVWVRQPSEAIAFVDLRVSTIFGIPLTANPVGMSIDVSRNIVSPFSMKGDKTIEKAFKMQSGMYMSAMEYIIFEWMLNVNSVSAVKVLQQANTLSMPVYIITSQNIGQILPLLQVSSSIKSEIQNATNAGLIVIIPKTEITLNNWNGTGYIIQNPDTMGCTYRISGEINGGSTSCLIEGNCYFNAEHPCVLPLHPENPWRFLLDDIDQLLAFADILLLGEVNLHGLADELCMLLQGISPDLTDEAIFAEKILQQFKKDVALIVIAISIGQIPPPVGDDLINFVVFELFLKGYGFVGEALEYSGYFTIHYLYEYVVLFRAGLITAFPELEY